MNSFPSKNQNPREGIETLQLCQFFAPLCVLPSKNQNPREGIETQNGRQVRDDGNAASKNQNPREGIETSDRGRDRQLPLSFFKKPKSPRGD